MIQITVYKHNLNISYENNTQNNYLSIELLLNLLATLFVEKTRFLSKKFSDSKFRMRVYKGKIEARNKGIPLYTFLRISPRKINILRKT